MHLICMLLKTAVFCVKLYINHEKNSKKFDIGGTVVTVKDIKYK